eukprot:106407_1
MKTNQTYNDDKPNKMKITRKSLILQTATFIAAITTVVIYVFHRSDVLLYVLQPIFIILSSIFAYHEIDIAAFKLVIMSFRGAAITIAVIVTIICNISRPFLHKVKQPFSLLILNDITWTISTFMMIASDCVPRMTNYFRIMYPLLVMIMNTWTVVRDIIDPDANSIIFEYLYGLITVNQIEIACHIQVIWYGNTFLYGVIRDRNHEFFVTLVDKIEISQLLPYHNMATYYSDICHEMCKIQTKYIFSVLSIFSILYSIVYMVHSYNFGYLKNYTETPMINLMATIILSLTLLVFVVILMRKHFEKNMINELLMQFRCNLLIISILIIIYTAIQKLIWFNSYDLSFMVQIFLNHLVFDMGAVLLLIRDGLNVSYPKYFVFLLSMILTVISFWNIFVLTFGRQIEIYPKWFVVIEKEAYIQVIIICALSIYYLFKDTENKYFVLIRKRKETKKLWGDYEYKIDNDKSLVTNAFLTENDVNAYELL